MVDKGLNPEYNMENMLGARGAHKNGLSTVGG